MQSEQSWEKAVQRISCWKTRKYYGDTLHVASDAISYEDGREEMVISDGEWNLHRTHTDS